MYDMFIRVSEYDDDIDDRNDNDDVDGMMMMTMMENKGKSTGDCVWQESRRRAFRFHVKSSEEVSRCYIIHRHDVK